MNGTVFGQTYADQYDLLYSDRDYDAECSLIEDAFRRYGKGPVETILDLGCGTGGHAFPLARRGYRVTGVDRSPEMLAHSQRKAQANLGPVAENLPTFVQGELCGLDLGRQFDAVLMMFAVLGYQTANEDVLAALRTVRRHLNRGGLFLCDVWYGPAVLTIRPSERVKVIPTSDGKLIRATSGILDIYRQLCKVRYQLWRLRGREVVSEAEESHLMRYFFPQELAQFLAEAQLQLKEIRDFGDLDHAPDENTWNVMVVGESQ